MQFNIKDNLNTPNIISFIRLLLVIPMIIFIANKNQIGIIVVVVLGFISDYLDGYTARKFDIVTEFGKVIDPLADKVFVGLTVVSMYIYGYIEFWFFSLVLGRDILIFLGGLYVTPKLGYVLPSNMLGKVTVNILALNLFLLLLDIDYYVTELTYFTSFFIILSFLSYLFRVIKLLKDNTNQKL